MPREKLNTKEKGVDMSDINWYESEDYKYDKFQAYWDFKHDHSKGNYKNACEQAFDEAWVHRQCEIEKLQQQLKEANYTINSLIHHFHRYGMDEESLVILMEVEKAREYLTKYKIKVS